MKLFVKLLRGKGEEMAAKHNPPPIVGEVAGKLNEMAIPIARPDTMAEKLHQEQVKDRSEIQAIQVRMGERRKLIDFLEDTPNAELMFQSLARFLPNDSGGLMGR